MSSIGPQLPPNLAKRKRSSDNEGNGNDHDATSAPSKQARQHSSTVNHDEIGLDDSDDDDVGPAPAPAPAPTVSSKPILGPSLPPTNNDDEIILNSDSDPDDTGPVPASNAPAQPKSYGPSLPPPNTNSSATATQLNAGVSSGSDSEDDYGPALPSAVSKTKVIGPSMPPTEDDTPQRDTWMLAPPPSSSTYSERDPTRIRARKFASKPGPAAPDTNSGISSIWTETPEEKLQRQRDALLGRSSGTESSAAAGGASSRQQEDKRERERERSIAANIESQRGKSLYDEHNQKRRQDRGKRDQEEDDDPSKRGFDREKDMAIGGKIGTAQRRELVNNAANFGSKFQKGSFL